MKSAQNKEETLGEACHKSESQGAERDACPCLNRGGGAGAGIQSPMPQQSKPSLLELSLIFICSQFLIGEPGKNSFHQN